MNKPERKLVVVRQPSPEELIKRAVALRPLLREQQEENAARGTYSQELHERFSEAGFYKISAPKAFGGYGYDLATFFKVMLEIAAGDPSVAWCLCLGASHAWFVASHWPEEAQRDFFAHGDFIAPHRATPAGKLTPVEGGYRLSGVWDYCSGIPYASHFIGNATIMGAEGSPQSYCVVVACDKVQILADWGGDRTIGMLSSGSNSVRVDDVFVPLHHVLPTSGYFMRASEMADGTPGTRLHEDPMYLGRVAAPYHMAICLTAIGALRAMIDEFEAMIVNRKVLPFGQQSAADMFERALGTALVRSDVAETLLIGSAKTYQDLCERWSRTGAPITEEDNMRLWGVCQEAGRISGETIDLLFHAAMSSSTTKKGSKVLRYIGDWLMYRAHPGSNLEMIAAPIARAHLGRPIGFMGL